MGVNIDDTDNSWRGPGGMEGRVNTGFGGGKGGDKGGGKGIERRDGDWDCPACGKMVFASKEECSAPRALRRQPPAPRRRALR